MGIHGFEEYGWESDTVFRECQMCGDGVLPREILCGDLTLTDPPYVCIALWMSLPVRQDVVEEFFGESDLIQLASEKEFDTT